LYEILKARQLIAYPDADIRLAMQRAVASKGQRGWKIDKAKQSHKIDVVVALAMAALGSVEGTGRVGEFGVYTVGPYGGPITPLPGGRVLATDASKNGCNPSPQWLKNNPKERGSASFVRGMY